MEIKEVEYDSYEWADARLIRYLLFYKRLGLPETLLDDAIEQIAFRLVLIDRSIVIGCARLSIDDGCGVITQMAVLPQYQGIGTGRTLMLALLNKARFLGISILHLNARSTAKGFYEKFGFVTVGDAFLSKTTGVEHIRMILQNSCSSRLFDRSQCLKGFLLCFSDSGNSSNVHTLVGAIAPQCFQTLTCLHIP